ncbi:unnamed protein product [Pedinophyceae sp. YPF-701]|nr:unnamed protein product [Pedinophyceae sp. YPF-701]
MSFAQREAEESAWSLHERPLSALRLAARSLCRALTPFHFEGPLGGLAGRWIASGRGGGSQKSRMVHYAAEAVKDDGSTVYMKGLPYQATQDDIIKFFSGFRVEPDTLLLGKNRQGQFSGCAWVSFDSPEEATRAINNLSGKYLGSRYVEIDRSTVAPARLWDPRGPPDYVGESHPRWQQYADKHLGTDGRRGDARRQGHARAWTQQRSPARRRSSGHRRDET